MSTHFTFSTDVLRHIGDAPRGTLAILVDLLCRASLEQPNVTPYELAFDAHIAEEDVLAAVAWLADVSYLVREGDTLTFPSALVNGPPQHIDLNLPDYENRALMEVTLREARAHADCLRRQLDRYERGEESGLAKELPDSADDIHEIEGILGRALTWKEVYFLGQMVDRWNFPKVIGILRTKWKAKDPLRTTYAVLNAMDRKQEAKRPAKEEKAGQDYWVPPKGFDPWAR